MESYLKMIELCLKQIQILKEKGGSKDDINYRADLAKSYIDSFTHQ